MNPVSVITLAYHRISEDLIPAGTWVTPKQLSAHLETIVAAELRFATPCGFLEDMDTATEPEPRPQPTAQVLITFDDGTEDVYRYRHVLDQMGVVPIVFVPVDFVGRFNSWEWRIPGRRVRHLTVQQLRELAHGGWEIGLHGSAHRRLPGLSDTELAYEIARGKEKLEGVTGWPVRYFSYPFGLQDDRVVAAVRQAGFAAAFILTPQGTADEKAAQATDPFRLARRPVYCIDSGRDILAKVADPQGHTRAGRWQRWKEGVAHGVGRATERFRISDHR